MSKHILKSTLFRTCQISHGPRPGVLHPWAIAPSGACSTCFQSMPHQTCCGPCCLCVITCTYILGFTFAFSISLLHWCTMAQKMINNTVVVDGIQTKVINHHFVAHVGSSIVLWTYILDFKMLWPAHCVHQPSTKPGPPAPVTRLVKQDHHQHQW